MSFYKEEKEKEKEYEQFLARFYKHNDRLPDLQRGEDSSMTDFEGFLPGIRRFGK